VSMNWEWTWPGGCVGGIKIRHLLNRRPRLMHSAYSLFWTRFINHRYTKMSTISSAIRSLGAKSLRQTTSRTTPPAVRIRLRSIHQSPLSRRAPVPNPTPRPTTSTTSGSTIAGTAGNGSRSNGSGGSTGAGGGGKKKPRAHALWYREIVPGMSPSVPLGPSRK